MSISPWDQPRTIANGPIENWLGSIYTNPEELTGHSPVLRPGIPELADMAISLAEEMGLPETAFLVEGYALHDQALQLVAERKAQLLGSTAVGSA